MKLTPMDIHNKEFDVKLHGYDKNQVDVFLDQIINDYSDALDTITDLQNSGAVATENVVEEKVAEPVVAQTAEVDETQQVGELLLAAQKSADLITENARKEAERIIAEAKEQASQIHTDVEDQEAEVEANRNLEVLHADYDRLKKRVADYRDKTKMLLQKELEGLDDENWQYWLDRYYGTERMYPVDGEPIDLTDDANSSVTTELDNESENDVESNQEDAPTLDMSQVASGDAPTNVEITPEELPDLENDGPVIIFPDDLKN